MLAKKVTAETLAGEMKEKALESKSQAV